MRPCILCGVDAYCHCRVSLVFRRDSSGSATNALRHRVLLASRLAPGWSVLTPSVPGLAVAPALPQSLYSRNIPFASLAVNRLQRKYVEISTILLYHSFDVIMGNGESLCILVNASRKPD